MITATANSISIATIRREGGNLIVDWLNQHQQSFYILGSCYLSSPQQIEEIFYRTILYAQKELPRFKSKIRFETWVTSIFVHNCREVSRDKSKESGARQGIFKALDQLQQDEKAAIVLTYVQRFTQEESAYLLQVSVGKLKELLTSGIQKLKNEVWSGSNLHGCMEYQKDYLDYLEQTMERSKKIDLEVHIYGCQQCQEELAAFQDVISTLSNLADRIEDLHMPTDLMENIIEKLKENEKYRQQKNKKRKRMGLVLGSAFAILIGIGFVTGTFSNLYYSWTEEDPELISFLQQDLGQRLNLEAENEGVKITIKSVIADDFQTLIFYEIEDTVEDSQYMMNYDNGMLVKNGFEIMNNSTYPRYYPPDLESDVNNREKNVYRGKVSMLPLNTDSATIELQITGLYKLIRNSSESQNFMGYENIENKTGEWNFEIPVTKKPSTEYTVDEVIEIEGIPIRFEKLTVAPTATTIQFSINHGLTEKRINNLNLNNLEVNNKKMEADIYGNSYVDLQQDVNWTTFQTHFDPLFGEKPKEVNVQLESANLTFEIKKTIDLDDNREYPQTFEYAGSTISIDKQEDEQSTNIIISNHELENRAYETFHYNFVNEYGGSSSAMEMNSEAVLVDKNGVAYELNQPDFRYEELEQPRYFTTVDSAKFYSENEIPKKLEIYGYQTTKYLDDVVKISLKSQIKEKK
ncbi:DUF4179 domain-containing protein [Psychrobacillus sp. NEAU-3TGS]|uniref:DUF4179 domain-containing protein n=1 Tax=Psychrobacillus sp. NEAU-3TGS TaxID=2995412 RepID=UPI0024989F46|nr:DUF4179 domain-containing protein [Psychrobacillus sp. NEAU-3TGS]MDI2589449.1 DUF4179 domain-containing protein [Psychrobacillus sp. NEAU-3TGS]